MATQIKVNSATGNVTVQLSRTVIGTVVTANTANYANFAGTAETANNLNAATTANVVIGGGTNGYVLQTNGAGTTSWVAQAGGGGTQPGGANTEVQYNDAGTMAGDPAFTFNDVTSTLTTGTISATNIGNITPTNLDGNTANYLDGTGTFAPVVAASATTAEQVIRLCKAAQTITKGQAVTITGGTGDNPDVSLSDASSAVLMPSIGIALENIAISALGNIALYGEVAGIDTTAFSVGDSVYISATIPGDVTDTAPKGETNLIQKVGKIVRSNANGIAMIQGAGRTNQTPNLDAGNIFLGDAFNQATTATLNTSIVPENTNLYYSNARVNSHLAAFGSNTITTTGNVSVGNLVADPSLLVNGVNGNVLIQPNVSFDGKTYSSITRGEYNTGTGNTTTNQAFIIDNYTTQGITNFQTYANTAAGQLAKGASFNLNSVAAIGNANTDPFVTSQITFNTNSSLSNLANASGDTATSMQMGGGGAGGFVTVIGGGLATDTFLSGAWKQFQYRPKAMDFIRRNGNGENRQSLIANDETTLNFYGTQTTGGVPARNSQYPAKIGSKIDPTWTDPDNGTGIPTGVFFTVVDENLANLEHRMYANGDTTFNTAGGGTPITLGYNGVITGDGGGLSNIASANVSGLGNIASINIDGSATNVLYGNGVFAPSGGGGGVQAQIANGTSNVNISAVDGNVTVSVGGTANVITATTSNIVMDGNLSVVGNTIIGDGTANVQIVPRGNLAFNSGLVQTLEQYTADYTGGPGAYVYNNEKAYIVNGFGTTAGTDTDATLLSESYYANDGTTTSKGFQQQVYTNSVDALGTDPLVASIFEQKVPSTLTNLANADTQTQTTLSMNQGSPGIFFSAQTAIPADVFSPAAPVVAQMNYSDTSIRYTRANGNADAKTQVVADDYIGRIEWGPESMTNGGAGPTLRSYPSFISAKVSSAFTGALGERVGQGIEFGVVNDTGLGQISHEFHPNGDVQFNSSGGGNSVTVGYNGNVTLSGGQFVGDGGGLSNVSATVTPAGFFDSVQFNDNGSLGGDATLTYSTSGKNLSLSGAAAGVGGIPTFNINNGGFNIIQEEIGGGNESFSFKNFYAGNQIAPSSHFRARGTVAAQTGVAVNDQVLNEGYNVNAGGTGPSFKNVGSVTGTIVSNDGAGNVGLNYTIDTSGADVFENDKIQLNTSLTSISGNVTMTGSTTGTRMRVRRFAQEVSTLATLPTVGLSIGERAFISDAPVGTTPVFTTVATAGGTRLAPVYWDGSDWRFG